VRAERRGVAGVQRRGLVDRLRRRVDRADDVARPGLRRSPHRIEGRVVTERALPVPDGLDGMRVDAGLSKLLGLSRTAVAAIAEAGDVLLDGRPAGKSDKLAAGVMLHVTVPDPQRPVEVNPVLVDGLTVLYQDDDVVVVDKPVG